jgi:hypothetical protein
VASCATQTLRPFGALVDTAGTAVEKASGPEGEDAQPHHEEDPGEVEWVASGEHGAD